MIGPERINNQMNLHVAITGANGMLATDLINVFSKIAGLRVVSFSKRELDIADEENVTELIRNCKADVVIHTAALTNVDLCEEDPELAMKINRDGTANVSRAAEQAGAKMVYISSCGLFGDTVRAYSEDDTVELKTQYAKSKYYGEEKVESICSKYFIVRPGWLFGGSIHHQKNFVYKRYLEAKGASIISSAIDKFGCPTYTRHLADFILKLMTSANYGVYHVTNSGSSSRFEYVQRIIEAFGLSTKVHPVSSDSFVRKAPVPNCEILESKRIVANGFDLLPSWEEALEEYVYKLKSGEGTI